MSNYFTKLIEYIIPILVRSLRSELLASLLAEL